LLILPYKWHFIIYEGCEFRPWRLTLFIYSIPGIIAGLWIYHLPESPKFLLSVNRNQEALDIVKWIYRMNNGTKVEFDILKLKPETQGNGNSLKGM
jgi:hypothetical protein